jgi:hypothetical protein
MENYDKLTIINDALLATGNRTVVSDNGSAEWIASSRFYDRCLPVLLYEHNWPFQTATVGLARKGSSAYPGYLDIYAKPQDCLHLENVWRTDFGILIPQFSGFNEDGMQTRPPALDYKIIGDQIHCCAPEGATALYVQYPNTPKAWPPGFVETLTRRIESFLYQGLNEDSTSAKAVGSVAEDELSKARAKIDSESPRRVAFRSRIQERRRTPRDGWWWGP